MRYEELTIEGRNAVLEAFRSGKTVDRLFVLDGCQDGPVRSIIREAKKNDTIITFVPKDRLDHMSETGRHQGVIAYAAAYEYATVESMLEDAGKKGKRGRREADPDRKKMFIQKKAVYIIRKLRQIYEKTKI